MSARKQVKAIAQGLTARVAPIAWRMRRSNRLLVLMYHRVLPANHPDRAHEEPGMYVSPETFDMHLRVLRREFDILQLDEWLEAAAAGKALPRRACAVTFDDGWRDNFDHAFPLLREHCVPATVFLVADLIGTHYSFWPNRLGRLLRSERADGILQALPESLRSAIGDSWSRLSSVERTDVLISHAKRLFTDEQMTRLMSSLESERREETPTSRDLASWEEIREMADSGLVRFGSHTRRHTRLRDDLDQPRLQDEIVGSKQGLADRLGVAPRTFCYPNGDHCPRAVAIVRDHYVGAVTTRHGWNSPGSDRWLLQRVGVHDDVSATQSKFLSRLAGIG